MDRVTVLIRRLPTYPSEWPLPAYATAGAAGLDLRNAGPAVTLESLERRLIPTGLAIALPAGTEAQVRPRSGLAFKRGLTLVNTPATIDSDYRGELLIPLVNLDREPQLVEHGERIAQLVLARVLALGWSDVEVLPDSARGEGRFGSTGR
jgi:dUTP pyrophosphatase